MNVIFASFKGLGIIFFLNHEWPSKGYVTWRGGKGCPKQSGKNYIISEQPLIQIEIFFPRYCCINNSICYLATKYSVNIGGSNITREIAFMYFVLFIS